MSGLPKGWATSPIKDVCRLVNGRAYGRDEFLSTGRYRVLRVGNLFTSNSWYYSDLELDADKYIDAGDLIYAWSASFGPRIWEGEKVIYHYHIWKCLPNDQAVEKGFMLRFLDWDTNNIKAELGTGSTMMHVTKQGIEARGMPIPPLSEQKRIVEKVDGLTARTKRARAELDRIPTLIARYKQRLLSLAFSGELTADWREKAKVGQEWRYEKLATLAAVGTGATPKRDNVEYYDNGSIPWVTSTVVNSDIVRSPSELITEKAIAETNCKVFPVGTLLVAMYGEGQTRGKVSTLGIAAATNQALAAIQVHSELLDLRFLFWFLKEQYFSLREKAAGGVQPNLNLRMIKDLAVPLPTKEEQAEITLHVEAAFRWLDRVTADHTAASKLLPKLDAAILAKAFRGELVPQDPNDEPASALLERIKANTAKPTPNARRKSVSRAE